MEGSPLGDLALDSFEPAPLQENGRRKEMRMRVRAPALGRRNVGLSKVYLLGKRFRRSLVGPIVKGERGLGQALKE